MQTNRNIEELQIETKAILTEYGEVEIKDKMDYVKAGELVKMVSFKVKTMEEKRKDWTKPILDAKKKIDDDFKEMTEPLDNLVRHVKSKMLTWQIQEQARLDVEQKKIEAEALKKLEAGTELEAIVPVVNDIKTAKSVYATTTVVNTWTYEILNEAEVPREYLCIDTAKLSKAVKAGLRTLSGVKIYQSSDIRVR